jgi:hypothetical protein
MINYYFRNIPANVQLTNPSTRRRRERTTMHMANMMAMITSEHATTIMMMSRICAGVMVAASTGDAANTLR